MKPLSASAAAKAVGKSTPTITRAIKSGKLSAKVLEKGGYEIDPAELFRVWPAVTRNPDKDVTMLGSETPNVTKGLPDELKVMMEDKITSLESQLADALKQRDKWQNQAEQLLLSPPTGKGRGLFGRLFGS